MLGDSCHDLIVISISVFLCTHLIVPDGIAVLVTSAWVIEGLGVVKVPDNVSPGWLLPQPAGSKCTGVSEFSLPVSWEYVPINVFISWLLISREPSGFSEAQGMTTECVTCPEHSQPCGCPLRALNGRISWVQPWECHAHSLCSSQPCSLAQMCSFPQLWCSTAGFSSCSQQTLQLGRGALFPSFGADPEETENPFFSEMGNVTKSSLGGTQN